MSRTECRAKTLGLGEKRTEPMVFLWRQMDGEGALREGGGGGCAPRWSDEGVLFVFIIQEVIVVPLVVPATAAVVVVVAGDTWGAGGAVGKGRLGRPLQPMPSE